MMTYNTERLLIRPLVLTDAQAIFDYRADASNFPYVDMPVYTSIDESVAYIEKMNDGMASGKWYCFALEVKETGALIGTLSIWNFNEAKTQAELGYGLFEQSRGKGYMHEALAWCAEFCFYTLNLKYIEAYTHIDNQPSAKLLEASGFSFMEQVMDEAFDGGPAIPMAVYALKGRAVPRDTQETAEQVLTEDAPSVITLPLLSMPLLDKTCRTVAITGAGSGLGRALALEYASFGHHMILLGRTIESLQDVQLEIEERGGTAYTYTVDITDSESVNAVCSELAKNHKMIDTLINNAGVGVFGPFEDMTEAEVDRMIATNLKGTILMTHGMLPILQRRIINIISTAGQKGKANEAVYCATKFAVRGFTESLQVEWQKKPNGKQVTAVYMGGMNTPFWANSIHISDVASLKKPEFVARLIYLQDDGRKAILI